MKTTDLQGAALDWAVCAAGIPHTPESDPSNWPVWNPSSDWAQAGPIIHREMISIEWTGENWMAYIWHDEEFFASSPLVASMRCYVAHKLGEEVEIPAELMGAA